MMAMENRVLGMLPLTAAWTARQAARRLRGLPSSFLSGFESDSSPFAGRAPQRVAVLGAGLAGLSAALRLVKLGHEVTVLEASGHAGGRAATLRDPFSRGLQADAGGFRFRDIDHLVKSYVKRYGLTTVPFYPTEGKFLAYIGGRLFSRNRWDRIPSRNFPRRLTEQEEWCFNQEHDYPTFKLGEGVNALANAMAAELGHRVQYNCPVTAIRHDTQSPRVTYSNADSLRELVVDQVVCAIPFSSLRRISITPGVAAEKQRTIAGLGYEHPCLVFLEVRTGFLKQLGLNGFAVTDTVGEIWNLTFDRPGQPLGILLSYTRGELARQYAAMDEPTRIDTIVQRLEVIFPGVGAAFERGVSKFWGQDEWILGAQSLAGRQPASEVAIMSRPEGRLHFAGEHTGSAHHGWMEAAFESGHRCALEIDRAPIESERSAMAAVPAAKVMS